MPILIREKINTHSSWGLWHITEDVESLLKRLHLSRQEEKAFALTKNSQKQQEWLASRILLKELAKEYDIQQPEIIKDAFGKPFLLGSNAHISLSHSYPYAAAIIHAQKASGIDIEHSRDQLIKVRHKFLNSDELAIAGNHCGKLCVYWTAKEALYKLYGRRGIILKEQILIEPFEFTDTGIIKGALLINDVKEPYTLHYRQYQDIHICYSL